MNVRQSWNSIWIILFLTAAALFPLFQLTFNFDIQKLYPVKDPDVLYYQEFQKEFQSYIDDETIFIGLENSNGIFQQEFLKKADSLTHFLSSLPSIKKVYSLTNSSFISIQEGVLHAKPLIQISKPESYSEDSTHLFGSQEFRDLLISKNGKSIAITAFHAQHLKDIEKDSLLSTIQHKVTQLQFEKSHVAGKILIERIYVHEIKKNLQTYLFLSISLVSICLFIMYTSLRAVVIPLLIIATTIIWTLSLMSLANIQMDILTILIPPLLATICMSNIIHFTSKYYDLLRLGQSKKAALTHAFKDIGLANFFTSLTTAIGFFTLAATTIIPVRIFGIVTGLAVLLSFFVTLVLSFSLFKVTHLPNIFVNQRSNARWNRFLATLFRSTFTRLYRILFLYAILVIIAVYFINKIEINGSFIDEIPKQHPFLQDYAFMEQQFYGTRSFEMALTLKDPHTSFYDIDILQQVDAFELFLKDSCHVGYVISPLSLIKGAHKAFSGGENTSYTLPHSQETVQLYVENIMQTQYADELQRYMLADGKKLRISGKLNDLSIQEFKAVHQQIDEHMNANDSLTSFSYRMTGSAFILDKIAYYLTQNLIIGLIIAFLVIIIIGFYILQSWSMIIISVLPNLIPLAFMAAIMGSLGIPLKSDTAVIFSISFGIAVDNTIHFMSCLRKELHKGLSLLYAIKRTYLTTGKSLILTTVVLLTGFLSLLSSSFGGTFYMGMLISSSLFFALVLNLTLLPILLILLYRK